jgi:DNA repair protein RadA
MILQAIEMSYHTKMRNVSRTSTGARTLDTVLYGGVETSAITQFYGDSSSGKTQLCHTICSIVSQDIQEGGIKGKAIYLDTEGTYRPERIVQIAKARGFDSDKTLESIILYEIHDTTQQELIIEKDVYIHLENQKNNEMRFKLLVVDSPITHFRSEYIGRATLPERQQRLFRFMRNLTKLAQRFNIAVVVTNQVHTVPDMLNTKKAVGGSVMNHAVTYSIHLQNRFGSSKCVSAQIVCSPYHPQLDTIFKVNEKGVTDIY